MHTYIQTNMRQTDSVQTLVGWTHVKNVNSMVASTEQNRAGQY